MWERESSGVQRSYKIEEEKESRRLRRFWCNCILLRWAAEEKEKEEPRASGKQRKKDEQANEGASPRKLRRVFFCVKQTHLTGVYLRTKQTKQKLIFVGRVSNTLVKSSVGSCTVKYWGRVYDQYRNGVQNQCSGFRVGFLLQIKRAKKNEKCGSSSLEEEMQIPELACERADVIALIWSSRNVFSLLFHLSLPSLSLSSSSFPNPIGWAVMNPEEGERKAI